MRKKKEKIPLLKFFFYTGRSYRKTRSYMNNGYSNAWAYNTKSGKFFRQADGDTFCLKRVAKKVRVEYGGYVFSRVAVKGTMDQANIYKACKAVGQQPVCVSPAYSRGSCILTQTKNFYFSYWNEKYGIDPMLTMGSYWYSGGGPRNRNLQNLAVTHRWSQTQYDTDGDTINLHKAISTQAINCVGTIPTVTRSAPSRSARSKDSPPSGTTSSAFRSVAA